MVSKIFLTIESEAVFYFPMNTFSRESKCRLHLTIYLTEETLTFREMATPPITDSYLFRNLITGIDWRSRMTRPSVDEWQQFEHFYSCQVSNKINSSPLCSSVARANSKLLPTEWRIKLVETSHALAKLRRRPQSGPSALKHYFGQWLWTSCVEWSLSTIQSLVNLIIPIYSQLYWKEENK